MRLTGLAIGICLFVSHAALGVQINELRIDQPGSDGDEYFELFGTPGTSLDGLTYVVIGDGASASGQIEVALDLTGSELPADGYFLAAEDADTFGATADLTGSLAFENGDNVTHLLVTGFTGAVADDLDVDDDGLLDATPWSSIVDGLALVEDPAMPPTSSEFHYAGPLGLPAVGPEGSSVPAHVFRLPDGGSFQIGAFDPAMARDTPGAANIPEPASLGLLAFAALAALRGSQQLRKRRIPF